MPAAGRRRTRGMPAAGHARRAPAKQLEGNLREPERLSEMVQHRPSCVRFSGHGGAIRVHVGAMVRHSQILQVCVRLRVCLCAVRGGADRRWKMFTFETNVRAKIHNGTAHTRAQEHTHTHTHTSTHVGFTRTHDAVDSQPHGRVCAAHAQGNAGQNSPAGDS
jgi:hypothetical protein